MKKCRHCGAPIEDKCDTICAYCGNPLGIGRTTEEPYSHQEYSQQHTAQQYDKHTQSYTQQPYDQQPQQNYSEQLKQALQRSTGGSLTPQAEARGKASIARFLAILSIPFNAMFMLAVIALVIAGSVKKDPNADEQTLNIAKTATILAIISICMGFLFFIGGLGAMFGN